MQLLDDSIQTLLDRGWIDAESAYDKAVDKKKFAHLLLEPPDELH